MPSSFDYAVIRIVPRVEREEFLNAGVVLFCLERRFLSARVHIPEKRLSACWPDLDLDLVERHLEMRMQGRLRISRNASDSIGSSRHAARSFKCRRSTAACAILQN
jgi:hypothetical protein